MNINEIHHRINKYPTEETKLTTVEIYFKFHEQKTQFKDPEFQHHVTRIKTINIIFGNNSFINKHNIINKTVNTCKF